MEKMKIAKKSKKKDLKDLKIKKEKIKKRLDYKGKRMKNGK